MQTAGKIVSYTPKTEDNKSKVKTFSVDEGRALAEMKAAGFTSGPSGDPHHFVNGIVAGTEQKEVIWGVPNCDKNTSVLMEYPVYVSCIPLMSTSFLTNLTFFVKWQNAPRGVTSWDKNAKAKKQLNTPLRVVFAVKEGCQIYCGVMGHSEVDANFAGRGNFIKLNGTTKAKTTIETE